MRVAVAFALTLIITACSSGDGADGVQFPPHDAIQSESSRPLVETVVTNATAPDSIVFTCQDCTRYEVERVIDGDTLVLPDGTRVRAFGYDTPERGEECFQEATERLRRLAGNAVRLEDGPRLLDEFDRRLAYLYTEDGASIDAAMVSEGYAEAWRGEGQHELTLTELMTVSQNLGVGCLWSR